MDHQGPPIQPRYLPTRALHKIRQQKRCYDVTLSGQEGSTRWHLANAHSVTGPAGSIYRMSFFGIQTTFQRSIGRTPNQHPYHIIQRQWSIGCTSKQHLYRIIQRQRSIKPTWKQISAPNSLLNNSWKSLLWSRQQAKYTRNIIWLAGVKKGYFKHMLGTQ